VDRAFRGRGTAAYILTVFSVAYAIAVVVTSLRMSYDPMNSRFLAPVYPALLILGSMPFRVATRRKRMIAGVAATLLLWIHVAATLRYVEGPREDRSVTGPYWRSTIFADPAWAHDPSIVGTLAVAPAGTPILSNIADAFAIWTYRPVKSLPARGSPRVEEAIGSHPGALVLIRPEYRRILVGVEELDRMVAEGRCVSLGPCGRGRLYRVAP
jgi:hypothetical protein